MKTILYLLFGACLFLASCSFPDTGGCGDNTESHDLALWSVDVNSGELQPVYTGWQKPFYGQDYKIIGVSAEGPESILPMTSAIHRL